MQTLGQAVTHIAYAIAVTRMNSNIGQTPPSAHTGPRYGRRRDGQSPQHPSQRVCSRQTCGNVLDSDDELGICKPCRRHDRGIVRERQREQQSRSSNVFAGHARPSQQPQQAASTASVTPIESGALLSLLQQQMQQNAALQSQQAAAQQQREILMLPALVNKSQQQQQMQHPASSIAPAFSRARSPSPTDRYREHYRQRDDWRGTNYERRSRSPLSRGNGGGRSQYTAPSGQANFERNNPEAMVESPCSWCSRREELNAKAYTHELGACRYYKSADNGTRKTHVSRRALALKQAEKAIKKESDGREEVVKTESDGRNKVIKTEKDDKE